MSSFDFNGAIAKAAQSIKQSTRCPEHGKSPDFKIIKTAKGAEVSWTFCCDKLADIVKQKFATVSQKHLGEALENSLKDIFKK